MEACLCSPETIPPPMEVLVYFHHLHFLASSSLILQSSPKFLYYYTVLVLQLFFSFFYRRLTEEYAKLSFEHEVKLIRLRTMLLRCIGASINVCLYASPTRTNQNNTSNNHPQENGLEDSYTKHLSIFMNVIDELKETFKSFVENPPKEIPRVIEEKVQAHAHNKFEIYR